MVFTPVITDGWNDRALAALEAQALAGTGSGPAAAVTASGKFAPTAAGTGQAFPAAPAGTKRMVIAPVMNDDGSAANVKVCFLRGDATNTKSGIPIRPTDGIVNINTTDPTQFFVLTINTGDGVYYQYLGD